MNAHQLVSAMEKDGIRLWEDGGALRFRAPKGVLTEERKALLRENRAEVLSHLTARRLATRITPDPQHAGTPFPLTDIQAAYLVGRGSAYGYGGVACHVYVELSFPADTDPERLEACWWGVVRRHGMLRAVVHPDGFQEVLAEIPETPVPTADLRAATPAEVVERVDQVRRELASRVPPTDVPPLFELRMTRCADELILHLSIDQLIVDYASLLLVLSELEDTYHGREPEALEIGFRDYVLARRNQTLTGEYDRARDYWTRRLPTLPPAPDLPLPPDGGQVGAFRRFEEILGAEQRASFEANAARAGVTASAAAMAAYAEVLGRWSRSPQFTLNVPTFTRLPLHADVDRLVGDFTAVELLAVDLRPAQTFAERAVTLRDTLLEDLEHSLYTGSQVLADLTRRSDSDTVLMPVVFTSTLGSAAARRPAAAIRHAQTQTPQVWLDCQVMERADELALSWDVREGVLGGDTAADLFAAFAALMTRLAEEPDAWNETARIDLPEATSAVRERVNDTAVPAPRALLHQGVLAAAERDPARVAVIDRDRELTYGELVGHASAVARALGSSGVSAGDLVAITMEKGWEQVAGVLGTLMVGAAYLPLDTTQPPQRRAAILTDAGASVVLTQSWLVEEGEWPAECTTVAVDSLPVTSAPPPQHETGPDDLAYVIYTSGSTGAPKGVMISHAAALNTVTDVNRRFGVTADDRVLALAQLGFDLSVFDIFGPLSVGATVVLPDPARRGDPSEWIETVRTREVTFWNSVPGQLQMVHDYLRSDDPPLSSLRVALLSGDWIPTTLPEAVRTWAPNMAVHSLGGATEASIWSIHHPIDQVDPAWRSIPYGRPMDNQTFHVLDTALRPCPDLVVGELHIGGIGLAQGYFGDPERTAARFIRHPETGERLYRTGDLGRYWPDGVIEFLGREDHQVKIRGYRIELGEVQAAVESLPEVGAAAVVLTGGRGNAPTGAGQSLTAFVEPAHRDTPLPLPETLLPAVRTAALRVEEQVDIAELAAFRAAFSEAALASIADTLAPAFADGGARSPQEVSETLGAAPEHHRLVRRWLKGLLTAGLLERTPQGKLTALRVPDPKAIALAWDEASRLESRAGWSPELFATVRSSAEHLPALIAGREEAAARPFSGADLRALTAAYAENAGSSALRSVLAAAATEIARTRDTSDPLRIMEVGLRGGGVANTLLPALADHPVDYLGADASAQNRSAFEQTHADDPRVRCAAFDPAHDPAEQGLARNSVDLLVCVGVVDNLPDAQAALDRLSTLVAPGGWMLLLANTNDDDHALRISAEFMAEHAGPFTDVRQAQEQSFLRHEQWRELLNGRDRRIAAEFPESSEAAGAFGQHLYLVQVKPLHAPVAVSSLTRRSHELLPEYSVPSHWEVVDALPRTENGKLDRTALEKRSLQLGTGPAEEAGDQTPRDDLERALADLWAELLETERIGRDDDLFALGGDSLLVARIVGRLRDGLAGHEWDLEWEVVLRHLLRQPTIAGLAAYLRELSAPEAETDAENSALVELIAPGPDAPVTVLVHAGTGTLLPYRPLVTRFRARSGAGHGLVGLELPTPEDFRNADPNGLVDRTAAEYVRALLDAGHTQVDVVGYCVGGVIATEVARGLSEAGATVRSLTVISSHSPTFRIDDELLSEYSFALMMGIEPADIGFPADSERAGAAVSAVLDRSPGAVLDGAIADLDDEFADVAASFQALEAVPRMARVTRMCEALPPELAGTYEPEGLLRALRTYQQSIFALSRHRAEPYAGDITFLRHNGAYPFPGSADTIADHWARICLGDLRTRDIPGEHFTCMTGENVPTVDGHLHEIIEGKTS
ncbi:non-ribosomal peptide synthetase [Nocardiopsis sp. L17-MgMaSL7]|uniref:non-ribosomal peptide synthetase n=1 Tax=Nocardiopsis sp. L17-MgMaSL7 TaxID=1938893 RepID=UPI000D712DC1|nr:non-ribosomal peptide synthetase [Nocardiopsis sp. L17-MgMaSL7]PWV55401.1 pyochelin synthetase [Nocardiopsis sp. L17-MgMaSL7]